MKNERMYVESELREGFFLFADYKCAISECDWMKIVVFSAAESRVILVCDHRKFLYTEKKQFCYTQHNRYISP